MLKQLSLRVNVLKEPPKEANTNKIWKLQKCVYGVTVASRFWYLRVKEEIVKLVANVRLVDPGLFYSNEHYKLIGILGCHVDDMIWGGNKNVKINAINNLKNTFMETDAFT